MAVHPRASSTTWINKEDFARTAGLQPSDVVPPTLYLPDGSRVPVCVVHAPLQEAALPPRPPQHFPEHRIGGGYPILIDVQGEERFASAGCLVTDGHTTYALTNRHVTGPAGTPVYTLIGGREGPDREERGQTADAQAVPGNLPGLARQESVRQPRHWPR